MEQRVESGEALRDGSGAQGGTGQTTQLLSASEQFYTRACARCGGLLVNEWYYDFDNTGEYGVKVLRCVQCGHRIDPVILLNQCRSADESRRLRRARHKHSLRTVTLGEIA